MDVQTGQFTTIERKGLVVNIILDFQKRQDAQTAYDNRLQSSPPPLESDVVSHEVAHGLDMDNDLVKEANQSIKAAESTAEGFVNKIKAEKSSMSEVDAEKRVREMLGLPPKEEKKKNDE